MTKRIKTIDRFLEKWQIVLEEKLKLMRQNLKEAYQPILRLLKLHSSFTFICRDYGINLSTEKSEASGSRRESIVNMLASKLNRSAKIKGNFIL